MVEYTCKYCKKSYETFEQAEKCEEQGLVGPNLEQGLLLSHKKVEDGFKIFYRELASEAHERLYFFEEFLIGKSLIFPVQYYKQTGSEFLKSLNEFRPSTKEEIAKVNKLIREDFRGIGIIRVSLEKNNIRRIHNNLELKIEKIQ